MATLKAGRLRHRVMIQQQVESQDPVSGEAVFIWQTLPGMDSVPCAIEPLSVREFIAAKALQSEVSARIVLRYRDGLNAKLRIVHGSKLYDPAGFLPDPDSGIEYLTSPVSLLEGSYSEPVPPGAFNVIFGPDNVLFGPYNVIYSGAP